MTSGHGRSVSISSGPHHSLPRPHEAFALTHSNSPSAGMLLINKIWISRFRLQIMYDLWWGYWSYVPQHKILRFLFQHLFGDLFYFSPNNGQLKLQQLLLWHNFYQFLPNSIGMIIMTVFEPTAKWYSRCCIYLRKEMNTIIPAV